MIRNENEMIERDRPWWASCQCPKSQSEWAGYHDSVYCRSCYAWLTPKCSGKKCYYCTGRPDYNIYAAREANEFKENEDKFVKELVQFFGRKETTKKEWKRHDRKKRRNRKRDH
jgi:hypothetical protein